MSLNFKPTWPNARNTQPKSTPAVAHWPAPCLGQQPEQWAVRSLVMLLEIQAAELNLAPRVAPLAGPAAVSYPLNAPRRKSFSAASRVAGTRFFTKGAVAPRSRGSRSSTATQRPRPKLLPRTACKPRISTTLFSSCPPAIAYPASRARAARGARPCSWRLAEVRRRTRSCAARGSAVTRRAKIHRGRRPGQNQW